MRSNKIVILLEVKKVVILSDAKKITFENKTTRKLIIRRLIPLTDQTFSDSEAKRWHVLDYRHLYQSAFCSSNTSGKQTYINKSWLTCEGNAVANVMMTYRQEYRRVDIWVGTGKVSAFLEAKTSRFVTRL